MNAKQALAERDRLRDEADRARAARRAHGDAAKQARERLKEIPRERAQALQAAARDGSPPDVAALDEEEAALAAQVQHDEEATKAAGAARRAASDELARLHHDEFAAFADHAETLTQHAAGRLADLEAGYRAAYEAASAAEAEWNLLVRDRNQVFARHLSPADRVEGKLAEGTLSPAANPLPAPDRLFGGHPVRPREVQPAPEVAA